MPPPLRRGQVSSGFLDLSLWDYNGAEMKPLPPPELPGTTEAERMDAAVQALFAAPRADFEKQESRLKARRERKKRRAKKG